MVESITDGDTLRVVGGVRVRLIGIDAPEATTARHGVVECFGAEATAHLARLVPPGTPVRLAYDVERADRHGRVLAYIYRLPDGLFVNDAMARDGYALPSTHPPNVAHAERFVAAAAEARAASRGLWSACEQPGSPGAEAPTGPAPPPAGPAGPAGPPGGCDPAYPDVCIAPGPPNGPDLDCGEIPHRRFTVRPPDPHGFDRDRNGVGCESG